MEAEGQVKKREDSVLFHWKMNSNINELVTRYKLAHQHWLIPDQNTRNRMINGVGPMNLVKNRMNYALWPGKRTLKQPDEWDNYRNQNVKGSEVEEDGILAFATANQQLLVTNWNIGQQVPEGKDLTQLQQSCIDFAPFLFQHQLPASLRDRQNAAAVGDVRVSMGGDVEQDERTKVKYQPQIELLLGTETGTVCCYDPKLRDNGVVIKYNNNREIRKQRKVDHVRWFEAMQEGTNSNKFIVVFDDGTFYVFFRDLHYPDNRNNQTIRIPTGGQHVNVSQAYQQLNDPAFDPSQPGAPEHKEYTREAIIKILQNTIEGYDFDKFYSTPYKQKNQAGPQDSDREPVRILDQRFEEIKDCIAVQSKICTHRCFNYIAGHYRHKVEEINPYMVLRFDCRQINDLVTFRVGRDRKEHWIVAACNDGYLRVFSLKNLQMHKIVKGIAGNPTCIDVARTNGSTRLACDTASHRDLIAVGYQDNSFVVYSILQGFKPLYRGCEHRSFVAQVKFDNYYMKRQLELLAQEEEEKAAQVQQVPQTAQKIGINDEKLSQINTSGRLARSSKNRLVDMLRRNNTRSLVAADGSFGVQREYRLVTSGEDGMVFFWNIMAPYNGHDLSKVEQQDLRNPMNLLVKVQPSQVTPVRSIHDIHLTETAQIYAVIVGPKMTTLVDNAGIMTYYEVKHVTPEEDAIEDEKERLAKEAEEAEKRAQQRAAAEEEERKREQQQRKGRSGASGSNPYQQNSSTYGSRSSDKQSHSGSSRGHQQQRDPYARSNRSRRDEDTEGDVDFDDRRERDKVPQSTQVPSQGVGYRNRDNVGNEAVSSRRR